MKNHLVHTMIGVIDARKSLEGYVFSEPTGVTVGNPIIIKSCLTKVIITKEDGSNIVVSPIYSQSCMNPDLKTIVPITVIQNKNAEDGYYEITVENEKYKEKLVTNGEMVNVHTEPFIPGKKERDCADCNNCGRC